MTEADKNFIETCEHCGKTENGGLCQKKYAHKYKKLWGCCKFDGLRQPLDYAENQSSSLYCASMRALYASHTCAIAAKSSSSSGQPL